MSAASRRASLTPRPNIAPICGIVLGPRTTMTTIRIRISTTNRSGTRRWYSTPNGRYRAGDGQRGRTAARLRPTFDDLRLRAWPPADAAALRPGHRPARDARRGAGPGAGTSDR